MEVVIKAAELPKTFHVYVKDPSSLTVMLCGQKIFSWATKVEAVELLSGADPEIPERGGRRN